MRRDQDQGIVDRRRFLRGAVALAGVGILVGCGVRPPVAQDPAAARFDKADAIRAELKAFEVAKGDNVSKDDVHWLHDKVEQLHSAAFSVEPLPSRVTVANTADLLRTNPNSTSLAHPWGEQIVGFGVTKDKQNSDKTVGLYTVYLGQDGIKDDGIARASIIRAIVEQQYVATQTRYELGGAENFRGSVQPVAVRSGLKWTMALPGQPEKGGIVDKANSILLAREMHDPTGEDDTLARIVSSSVYRRSIMPELITASGYMGEIYSGLCVPLSVVRQYHRDADSSGWQALVDKEFASNGIRLRPSPANQLINLEELGFPRALDILGAFAEAAKSPQFSPPPANI